MAQDVSYISKETLIWFVPYSVTGQGHFYSFTMSVAPVHTENI